MFDAEECLCLFLLNLHADYTSDNVRVKELTTFLSSVERYFETPMSSYKNIVATPHYPSSWALADKMFFDAVSRQATLVGRRGVDSRELGTVRDALEKVPVNIHFHWMDLLGARQKRLEGRITEARTAYQAIMKRYNVVIDEIMDLSYVSTSTNS